MGRNLYVIIKENCKLMLGWNVFAAVLFLCLVPFLYGITNLNAERAADCFGKLVVLTGIPLFVPVLKPEQDSDIRDIIFMKAFPYQISILFRILFVMFLCVAFICLFALQMRRQGCEFPMAAYTMRTVGISMLIGGVGTLGSVLFGSTVAGFFVSLVFTATFYHHFVWMVLGGVPGFAAVGGILLYGVSLLLCGKRMQ